MKQLSKLDRTVSHWLRQFRTTLNLSTTEVEELTGINRDEIEDYENERKAASVSDIELFSDAFYAKPALFFATVEDNAPQTIVLARRDHQPQPRQESKPVYIPQQDKAPAEYIEKGYTISKKGKIKAIAKEITKRRLALGLSVIDAARLAGIDPSYIRYLEAAKRAGVTERVISKLANGYQTTVAKLSPTFYNAIKVLRAKDEKKQAIATKKANRLTAKTQKQSIKPVENPTGKRPYKRHSGVYTQPVPSPARSKQIVLEIRAAREKVGLTQMQVNKRLKKTSWIEHVETNRVPIRQYIMDLLEKAFKMPGKKIAPSFYITDEHFESKPVKTAFRKNSVTILPPDDSESFISPKLSKEERAEAEAEFAAVRNTEKPNIDWLRYYRIRDKFTQTKVAEHIGVTASTYNLMESGSIGIKAKYLDKLTELYKVDRAEFFRTDAAPTQNISRISTAQLAVDENKAAWLRYHRISRKLQQITVAEGINMHPATYSNIENGKGPIYDATVQALMTYYKMDVKDLFKPEPPPQIFTAGQEVFKRFDRRDIVIGRRIDKLRKRHQYTTDQVAALTKIPAGTYANIIAGKARATEDQLRAFAKLYNVPKSELERPDKFGNLMNRMRHT
jgi:transcriptional regulator with XRE-family HTH domain